ncbi:SdrD B-like domain-containing protein [Staphylococcus agnetis]|uniref:SdrD B-like domain-containing protein n=1 Tax=Staphylococcus agnetis TaxID=985762 RepID=UPI000D1AD859|nr:SdrD B-like domain-containing protein [Staphylococcus agnetis]PTH57789.1 hypothetical protein BU584_07735 [Staphylococcus agnetis]
MKKLDFLPNTQNKYGIRKFTIGTASILLGTLLFIGTDEEAKAAEETTSTASASTSTSESSVTQPTATPTSNALAPSTPTSDAVTTADTSTTNSTNTVATTDNTTTNTSATPSNTASSPEVTPVTDSTAVVADNAPSTTTNTVAPTSTQPETVNTASPVSTASPTLASTSIDTTRNDSNTLASTTELTPTTRSIILASQPTTTPFATATGTGTNVNNLVTVTNPTISKTTIDPNQSGNFRLTANYAVNGKVKGGDYFTIQMPTYANINGELDFSASNNQFPISLYSPAGYVVANGVYDTTTKTLTYTFTDWVNDKENISGRFNLAQFADRKTAVNSGTYNLNYNLAGETYNTQITYNYDRHDYGVYPSSVDTMITSVDGTEKTNTFKETIYVNPKDVDLSNARLILGKDTSNSNAIINYDTTKLHIYRITDPKQLNDSYYFDPTGFPDLAQSFYNTNRIYMNAEGKLEVNFGGIDTPYVVVMESKFDPTYSNDLSTRATLIATDKFNYTATYSFDNGFLVETSSGSGDGTTKTYSLGDYVWEDSNQNGIQDAGEAPIPGVVVTLRDSNGYVVKTGVTDKYGNYLFSGLNNGSYTVDFVTPDGYVPTVEKAGTDTTDDSDGTSVLVTIDGADNFTIDSGFYKPTPEPTPVPATYNLGDYVWNDSNKDGIQNSNEVGIEGVVVTLTKPDGTTVTTTTDASGKYVFKDLENGEYTITFTTPNGFEPTLTNVGDYRLDSNGVSTSATINNADNMSVDSGFYQPTVEPTPVPATYNLGDYVWNDSNNDGIQNSNEVGIEGVVVTLTKPDGTTITTTTDASGKYVFTGLENGEYTVTFTTPNGFEPTLTNVGDNQLDSDGLTTKVTINNSDNMSVDSGFYQPTVEPTPVPATYNLGDYVWNDSNKDGIQNSNEVGIEGVVVTLTKPDGTTVTTTTDASGKYVFNDLENGEYTVTFTTPEGFEPTLTNVGDNQLDSDGLSTKVTINNADNMSVDSGFYQPTVEPTPQPTPNQPSTVSTHESPKSGPSDKSDSVQTLPETGQDNTNTGLIGTLIAGLGAMFVLRRKRHANKKH